MTRGERLLRCCGMLAALAPLLLVPLLSEADDAPLRDGELVAANVLYRPRVTDEFAQRMCRLDVYVPASAGNDGPAKSTPRRETAGPLPVVVWLHGGGLTSGGREVPQELQGAGVLVVPVDYRLAPQVTVSDCIDDAAAAVAWTLEHIGRYGGRADRVFLAGHSAGGYLTMMVGLDRRWLEAYGHRPGELAGLVPYSGHTITHFTERKARGMPREQPLVDAMAPLYHVRDDAPPLRLITGDRDRELLGRYEENAYFWRMMQVVEHSDCELLELDGFDHGGMVNPAHALLLDFVRRRVRELDRAEQSADSP